MEKDFQLTTLSKGLQGIRVAHLISGIVVVIGILLTFLSSNDVDSHAKISFLVLGCGAISPQAFMIGISFLPVRFFTPLVHQLAEVVVTVAMSVSFMLWSRELFQSVNTLACIASVILSQRVSVDHFKLQFLGSLVGALVVFCVFIGLSISEGEYEEQFWVGHYLLMVSLAHGVVANYMNEKNQRKKFLLQRKGQENIQKLKEETRHLSRQLSQRKLLESQEADHEQEDFLSSAALRGSLESPMEKILQKLTKLKKNPSGR